MVLFDLLELSVYLLLFPIVYKVLISVDFSKIFRKDHVLEIRTLYIFITIVITKIVGDFFIETMELFRSLAGII